MKVYLQYSEGEAGNKRGAKKVQVDAVYFLVLPSIKAINSSECKALLVHEQEQEEPRETPTQSQTNIFAEPVEPSPVFRGDKKATCCLII